MANSPSSPKLLLRRVLHAGLRILLRFRSQPYAPPATVASVALVLAPHPDDDALGCGGLIARKRLEGARVHVAYITDGSASHSNHPAFARGELAERRQGEARAALRVLGVDGAEISFLGAPDGRLAKLEPAAVAELTTRLAGLIARVRPDEIFLPSRQDGSSEHEAAFRLAQAAWADAGLAPRIYEFPVWAWWSPRLLAKLAVSGGRVWRFDFTGYEFLKCRAIAAHCTQVTPVPPGTRPVLAPEFVSFFTGPVEYYFET